MKYDRQKIADMRKLGYTYEQIANELGTTKANISSQISMMKKAGWDIITINKWSKENTKDLIKYRNENRGLREIADLLNQKYDTVKRKASELIQLGLLEATPRNQRSIHRTNWSKMTTIIPLSEEQLKLLVLMYKTNDACPNDIKYQVKKYFGSWSNALIACNLPPNIGGKMSAERATTVYLLDFGEFKKIGITQRQLKQRFSGAPAYVVLDTLETSLDEALEFEEALKVNIAPIKFIPSDLWFERNGKTECFIGPQEQLADLL